MRFKGGIESQETSEKVKASLEKQNEHSMARFARTISLEAPKDGINADYIDELKPYNGISSDDINARNAALILSKYRDRDVYSQIADTPADELECVKALDREIEALLMQGHDEFKAIAEGDFEEVTADWDDDFGEESKGKSR